MKYFIEDTVNKNKRIIRYEEGKTCERYDINKKQWVKDYRAYQIFGKMCMGDIDVEVKSASAAQKIIKEL